MSNRHVSRDRRSLGFGLLRPSLRTFWADDGLYVDPDVPEGVRGPEALATEIERQLKLYPGMSIVSSAADVLGVLCSSGNSSTTTAGGIRRIRFSYATNKRRHGFANTELGEL